MKSTLIIETQEQYFQYLQSIELRKNGCCLEQIAQKTGVNIETVSIWVEHISLNKNQKKCLNGKATNMSIARKNAVEANRKKYEILRNTARKQGYNEANGCPLHVAGCMLYWAEGSKLMNTVVFSNTDVVMQKKFKDFLEYLNVSSEKIKFSATVHKTEGNASLEQCKEFWSKQLDLPIEQIKVYHSKDNRGNVKTKSRYPFGVGRIEVYDYTVVQRIYGGIEKYIQQEISYGRK